jgi:hypothetical protein
MAANDENPDHSYSANSDDESYDEKEGIDRDEVKEVRKLSSKDTTRIRCWRLVVTVVLLLTAFAVTFRTYKLLQQQEHENFVTAVRVMCYVSHFDVQCTPNAILTLLLLQMTVGRSNSISLHNSPERLAIML